MIRDKVRDSIAECIDDALRWSHESNYQRLYVTTDGDLYWSESMDRIEYGETPYLANVGTGSVPCNCDDCQSGDPDWTIDDYQFGAGDYQYAEEEMTRRLDDIEYGYFDDED